MTASAKKIDPSEEFVITRTFDAPLATVWDAWTVKEKFGTWFGPKGFHSEAKTFDIRKGGIIHSCLKSADGTEMWAKFVFREVVPQTKLVWEHSFSDKDGNITRHPMSPNWPAKLLTTVYFEAEGNKTKITLTWSVLDGTELERSIFKDAIPSMQQGWGGTFEQLTDFLK